VNLRYWQRWLRRWAQQAGLARQKKKKIYAMVIHNEQAKRAPRARHGRDISLFEMGFQNAATEGQATKNDSQEAPGRCLTPAFTVDLGAFHRGRQGRRACTAKEEGLLQIFIEASPGGRCGRRR